MLDPDFDTNVMHLTPEQVAETTGAPLSIDAMTGQRIDPATDQPLHSTPMQNQTPVTPPFVAPIATADGITLKRVLFAVQQKNLPKGTLAYKHRFALDDEGNAVYALAVTQSEVLELQTEGKPLQAHASALNKEATALGFEQRRLTEELESVATLRAEANRLLAQQGQLEPGTPERAALAEELEKVRALTPLLAPEVQQSKEARLVEIAARFDEIAIERGQEQVESLPLLDTLLASKLVAVEWQDETGVRRSKDCSDVLNDLELKAQISELLMNDASPQAGSQGAKSFLPRR